MNYDPIKQKINKLLKTKIIYHFFYICLDLFVLRQWYIKKKISSIIKSNTINTFYDAGSGFCQYSFFVLSKKIKVHAVDLKADFLSNFAKIINNNDFTYQQADLTGYKLSPKKADLAIAADILEHIEDDVAVLRNIRDSLNKNGLLIVSTPSNYNTANIKEHYRNGYSKDEICQKLENTGFQIVSSEYTYGFWGYLHWLIIMKGGMKIVNFCVYLLPIYLLFVFLPSLLCMGLDFFSNNNTGKGVIIIARSNEL